MRTGLQMVNDETEIDDACEFLARKLHRVPAITTKAEKLADLLSPHAPRLVVTRRKRSAWLPASARAWPARARVMEAPSGAP